MNAQNAPLRGGPKAYVGVRTAMPKPQKSHSAHPLMGAIPLLVVGLALGVIDALLPNWGLPGAAAKGPMTRVVVFAVALLALYVLLMAISVGVSGKVSGVFWSSRNTYSLSRLQVVLWTWLILSALMAVVVCRAWSALDAGSSDGLATALDIYIPPELLTIMGISIASGAAAPAILSLKSMANAPSQSALDAAAARVGADVHAVGKVFVRSDWCPPLFKDLFESDDAAAAGTIDISKVQQFAVTLVLWSVYLAMLIHLFYTGVSGKAPAGVAANTTILPQLSDTFVYLLAISHAGYLAYKAVPVPPAANGAHLDAASNARSAQPGDGVRQSPLKPSTVLPRPLPPSTI